MIGGIRYGCRELAPKYSQFVDGTLRGYLVDVIERHLLTCDRCVAEVRQLRGIRAMLRDSDSAPEAGTLQSRLVSIAGDQATAPLALRPGSGALPTKVRSLKRAATAAMVLTVSALLAWAGMGLVAAPRLIAVTDLGAQARAEFTAAISRLPLENPAVIAVLAVKQGGVATNVDGVQQIGPVERRSPLAHPSALLTLAAASREPSHGLQRVFLRAGAGFVSVDVETTWVATGAFVVVRDQESKVTLQGFLPRGGNAADPDWQGSDYELAGWAQASTVAGVLCDVVEASVGGQVVARWRIDAQSGLVLWEERYGTDGALTLSAGYTSVLQTPTEPGGASGLVLSDRRGTEVTGTASCDRGWTCPPTLRGLPLVWLAVDRVVDPTRMTAVYSDGMTTITLLAGRGAIADAPAGFQRGDGCFEADGMPALVVWQSGESTLSLSTNGGLALARAAAAELPREAVHGSDLLGRIIAGWAHLTGVR